MLVFFNPPQAFNHVTVTTVLAKRHRYLMWLFNVHNRQSWGDTIQARLSRILSGLMEERSFRWTSGWFFNLVESAFVSRSVLNGSTINYRVTFFFGSSAMWVSEHSGLALVRISNLIGLANVLISNPSCVQEEDISYRAVTNNFSFCR